MKTLSLSAFAAAFVALSQGVIHAETPDTGLVTVRATPGLPASVIDYIARIGQSMQVEVEANQFPEEIIAAYCGATTKAFLAVYDSLNAADVNVRARVPYKRWPKLPACIQWEQRVPPITIEPATPSIQSCSNTLDGTKRRDLPVWETQTPRAATKRFANSCRTTTRERISTTFGRVPQFSFRSRLFGQPFASTPTRALARRR
jgi:hypothetical protein